MTLQLHQRKGLQVHKVGVIGSGQEIESLNLIKTGHIIFDKLIILSGSYKLILNQS